MTEPTRLLQSHLDATERRAILAAVSDEPPEGAEAHIWEALALALPATGVLVGATTATNVAHATAGNSLATLVGASTADVPAGVGIAVLKGSTGVAGGVASAVHAGSIATLSAGAGAGTSAMASSGLGIVASKAIAIGLGIGLTVNAATLAVSRQGSPVLAPAHSSVQVDPVAASARVPPAPRGHVVGDPTREGSRVEIARPTSPVTAARPAQVTATELQASEALPRDALADESSLITRARQALQAGDVTAAMARIEEHRNRFPAGALTQECDALNVLVYDRAGRTDAARASAAEFLLRYPSSPHAERMRAIAQTR
jgi:hypothetical protein